MFRTIAALVLVSTFTLGVTAPQADASSVQTFAPQSSAGAAGSLAGN